MFSFLTNACKKLYQTISAPLKALFNRSTFDEQSIDELRTLLIGADVGTATTEKIIQSVIKASQQGLSGDALIQHVRSLLINLLKPAIPSQALSERVIMMVGVNGSGKTTTIAKLTAQARRNRKRVLLVAADTFRAAAPEQLSHWAQELGATIVTGTPQQDPASVVFAGCQKFKDEASYDLMIIDTSGRVQTKTNLMDELAKLRRVISKQLPQEPVAILLTIDSMLGQNSLQQAELFHACTPLSGIILTKLDGTGKGGIIFAIADQLKLPIQYVTTGEGTDQIAPFDPTVFVDALLG